VRWRSLGGVTVAAGTFVGACLLGAGPVGADAVQLQGQGWWTELNPGVAGVAFPAPPDVPAQGLLVESEVSGSPLAYAALVFDVPGGSVPSTLTLTIAPHSDTTAKTKLEVCPLVSPTIVNEQGGPKKDGPAYDCSTPVTATPDPTGSSYQFDVSGFPSTGGLGVAILPTSPTDRVVLDQPEGSWLAVTQSAPSTTTTVAGSASGAPTGSSSSSGGTALPPITPAPTPVPNQYPVSSPTAAPPAPTPKPVTSPPKASAPGSSSPGQSLRDFDSFGTNFGPANPLALCLVIIGLLGGATLWLYAGRRRSDEEMA
jgi:hypothetical protein